MEGLEDILGSILAGGGIVAFHDEAVVVLQSVIEHGRTVQQMAGYWYHHNLAARIKPWLWASLIFNTMMMALVWAFIWLFVQPRYASHYYGTLAAWSVIMLMVAETFAVVMLIRLRNVHPIDWEYYRRWEEHREVVARNRDHRRDGEPEEPVPHLPPGPRNEAMALAEWGPNHRLWLGPTLAAFIASFWLTGGWICYGLGPFLKTYVHVPWVFVAVVMVPFGFLTGAVGYLAYRAVMRLVSQTFQTGGQVLRNVFNLFFRETLIALPGITAENYEELVPPVMLPFERFGAWLAHDDTKLWIGAAFLTTVLIAVPEFWVSVLMLGILLAYGLLDFVLVRKGENTDKEVIAAARTLLFWLIPVFAYRTWHDVVLTTEWGVNLHNGMVNAVNPLLQYSGFWTVTGLLLIAAGVIWFATKWKLPAVVQPFQQLIVGLAAVVVLVVLVGVGLHLTHRSVHVRHIARASDNVSVRTAPRIGHPADDEPTLFRIRKESASASVNACQGMAEVYANMDPDELDREGDHKLAQVVRFCRSR